MREQASTTLKALNEARVALEAEARGHLATQSQLLELHQVLQKEREFYVLEMQADRELKVRLEATQAELASTRKVLDEARFSKDEQLAAVQRTHELQKQQLLHAAANAREANLFRYEPYSMTLTLTLFRDPNPNPYPFALTLTLTLTLSLS